MKTSLTVTKLRSVQELFMDGRTVPCHNTSILKIVTEIWRVQECLEKINQKGITRKLRKGEQSFLCATRRPDLLYNPITLHTAYRSVWKKINQRGIIWKLRKGEQSFFVHDMLS